MLSPAVQLITRLFSISILSHKTAKNGKLVACPTLAELATELGLDTFRKVEIPLEVYECGGSAGAGRLSRKLTPYPAAQDGRSAFQFASRSTGARLAERQHHDRRGAQSACRGGRLGNKAFVLCRLPKLASFFRLYETVCLFLPSKVSRFWRAARKPGLTDTPTSGPTSPGIFRRPPSATNVAHIAAAYHRGHPVRLDLTPDGPYLAASLLKQHLAGRTEPVFSRRIAELARECPLEDAAAADYVRQHLVPLLAPSGRQLLSAFLFILARISANSAENLMTSANLAVCICPALLGGVGASLEEVEMCRVPGMQVGTMRGLQAAAEDEAKPKENSLGGVLRLMIDLYVSTGRACSRISAGS